MKTSINIKKFVCLSVSAALLLCCSVSRANLTGVTGWYYSSGISCYPTFTTPEGADPVLTITGNQTTPGSASMWGHILADTPSDPNLTINNQINNLSGVDWASFTVDVYMGTSFQLGLPAIPVANPSGWNASVTVVPYDTGGGNWWGRLTFTGGTPVSANTLSPDNLLDYTYKILNFSGSLSYGFSEVVTITPVPEPASATFILLGMGALVCTWRLKQNKQA